MDTSFRLLTNLVFDNIKDIVTPIRFLELFSEGILVDMIFGYNKTSCTVIPRK